MKCPSERRSAPSMLYEYESLGARGWWLVAGGWGRTDFRATIRAFRQDRPCALQQEPQMAFIRLRWETHNNATAAS